MDKQKQQRHTSKINALFSTTSSLNHQNDISLMLAAAANHDNVNIFLFGCLERQPQYFCGLTDLFIFIFHWMTKDKIMIIVFPKLSIHSDTHKNHTFIQYAFSVWNIGLGAVFNITLFWPWRSECSAPKMSSTCSVHETLTKFAAWNNKNGYSNRNLARSVVDKRERKKRNEKEEKIEGSVNGKGKKKGNGDEGEGGRNEWDE